MSLHKFAEQVASQGRGDDSLLVHMTPDEVRNLQQFAQANGTTLTINPVTGLPEAGMLSDLFKAVAPIALGAFLGPGAFGIAGLGMSAGTAGLVTGGLTTLATGSLSRGLMAGLGAYGGAGLAEGLMGAGVGAAQQSAMGSLSADQIAAEMAQGAFSFDGSGLTQQGVLNQAAADATKSAMANTGQAVSSGFNAVTATPSAMGTFAKQNLGNIAAAAAPIMAGQMVPTTTKMPENTNPAYIRQKLYDPYTQTYKSLAPVKASEFGSRNFSDAYTNPQTGQMATLDQRQPTPMAGGGIVALAGGGNVKHYAIGDLVKADIDKAYAAGDYAKVNELAQANKITAADVADTYKGFDTSGLAGLGINLFTPPAAPTYTQYTEDQMGSFLSNPVNKDIDLGKAIKDTNADPAAVNRYIASLTSPFVGSTESDRGSGTFGIYNQMVDKSISPDEYYKAALANDPKYAGWTKDMIQEGYNLNKGMYALSDAKKGVVTDADWAKLMVGQGTWDNPQYDVNEMAQATGLSKQEVRARYELEKLKANPIIKTVNTFTGTGGTGTGTVTGGTGVNTGGTGGVSNGVIPGGFYGNATNPGDITTNKDGTVTVHPNIPYRPYGGFSGMGEVRDAYTKGGGSLGYTAPIPKDPEASFNKMTDDSLDAYNFLMGKGKNLAQVNAARSRPLMQPYFTGSNRYKPKFLSYDKDGQVVSSATSGKQGDAKVADLTKAKTIEVVDSSGYNTETYTAVLQDDGTYLAGNGKRYDVTGKQIAAGGGMMGYAMGGGLGSLGSYSDGGRLLRGPGDGVSDSIPATIGAKQQPARLADGEFVIPARIVSELGNGSTDAGAKKLYAMMDRVQRARGKTTGKNKVAANSRADKHLPA
jgi:hypothetical protein